MTNHAPDKDHYNTSLRECMKRSMEKPAGEFKPFNRREHYDSWKLVITVVVWGLILGFIVWHL